ncbi:methylcytosine dioxygenase TET3-like isoform X3 [Cherax quadricarinatus]|uniref:methylcytosine dioxygenase TET3-like isoform X3 n=1 Tax=Cherax quadricarinatus TaxID=27406 RepID=UPI00387E72C5
MMHSSGSPHSGSPSYPLPHPPTQVSSPPPVTSGPLLLSPPPPTFDSPNPPSFTLASSENSFHSLSHNPPLSILNQSRSSSSTTFDQPQNPPLSAPDPPSWNLLPSTLNLSPWNPPQLIPDPPSWKPSQSTIDLQSWSQARPTDDAPSWNTSQPISDPQSWNPPNLDPSSWNPPNLDPSSWNPLNLDPSLNPQLPTLDSQSRKPLKLDPPSWNLPVPTPASQSSNPHAPTAGLQYWNPREPPSGPWPQKTGGEVKSRGGVEGCDTGSSGWRWSSPWPHKETVTMGLSSLPSCVLVLSSAAEVEITEGGHIWRHEWGRPLPNQPPPHAAAPYTLNINLQPPLPDHELTTVQTDPLGENADDNFIKFEEEWRDPQEGHVTYSLHQNPDDASMPTQKSEGRQDLLEAQEWEQLTKKEEEEDSGYHDGATTYSLSPDAQPNVSSSPCNTYSNLGTAVEETASGEDMVSLETPRSSHVLSHPHNNTSSTVLETEVIQYRLLLRLYHAASKITSLILHKYPSL